MLTGLLQGLYSQDTGRGRDNRLPECEPRGCEESVGSVPGEKAPEI